MKTKLSIIIPTLNEEFSLGKTLQHLDPSNERIIVDGGSTDKTVTLARQAGCTTLTSPPGRAGQMNLGAQTATGSILLFLHGDTLVPHGYQQLIERSLGGPKVALGAFSLGFDTSEKKMQLIATCANLRSRYLQLPYGDQALFTTRDLFFSLGGFPEVEIMEDYIFVRNMKKKGRIATLPEKVITSARRFQNLGMFRTTVINQLIITGFTLGVPPAKLARLYQRLKGVSSGPPPG